jgi:periplasmic protein TonB
MVADEIARATRRRHAVVKRTLAVRRAQERRFWIGVACAAVLHAAILFGASRSSSLRQMGERDASPDGISVELVDEADFNSRTTVPPMAAANPPANPASTDSLAQPPPPAAEPEPPAPSPPAPEPKKTTAIEKAPEPVSRPDPAKKPSSSAPATKMTSVPAPHSEPLQLGLPDASFAPPGRSAAFARPPGITRSGENDDFGRGVVRALRQTMPGSTVLSQVTVRLLLSETGNLVEVRLVRSGGDPILDQNVVFAVKQSNFPIPPVGSTILDRTFMVTYVYR